jgi:hypothetical protein
VLLAIVVVVGVVVVVILVRRRHSTAMQVASDTPVQLNDYGTESNQQDVADDFL